MTATATEEKKPVREKRVTIPAKVFAPGAALPANVAAAVKAELQRRGALPKDDAVAVRSPSFRQFMRETSPKDWDIDYPYLDYLRERLAQVTLGACRRLMVFMPPRHTKSETVTIRYPVYRLERCKTMRAVVAAYNHDLASRFTLRSRRIASERIALATDKVAADDWQTVEGGGVRAVGVGGGLTGHGADLIVIDDPVKSREEAESEVYREKVWQWFTNDLYTRLEPGGAILLVTTRWHEDDLAGRILLSDQAPDWTVISLPALAEEDDPLGREVGAALCPARYDVASLNDIRAVQGEYAFDALYQQHPTSREGAFFRVSQLKVVSEVPATVKKKCRAWDQAATGGGGDYTAGARIEGPCADGLWYVANVVRGQWSTDKRNAMILRTAKSDGRDVKIVGAQDPGSAGVDAGKAFTRMLAGYAVKTERVTGNKETRADPFSAQVNAGNVRLLRGAWNQAFVEELRTFPNGKYDDQVDSSADGFNELAGSTTNRITRSSTLQRRRFQFA